jgi:hypothetical protein
MTSKRNKWMRVVFASDCKRCECCGDLICPHCDLHYAECDCPGPTMDDTHEYKTVDGIMWARRLREEQ